jgi:hypothetical protein
MDKIEQETIESIDELTEWEYVELSAEELGEVGGGQSSAAILD